MSFLFFCVSFICIYLCKLHTYAAILLDHMWFSWVRTGGPMSENFCNFWKLSVNQSRPLYTPICQVYGGEKIGNIQTSLSSSFFILYQFTSVSVYMNSTLFQFEQFLHLACPYDKILLFSPWLKCGCLYQLWTLLPSDAVRQHVVSARLFWVYCRL